MPMERSDIENGRRRPVVVHVHLFKNAGTSVEAALRELVGSDWRSFDGHESDGIVTTSSLRELLVDEPSIRAVSSHQIRPSLDLGENICPVPIVFLRHPLDRIRSAYDFERNQGAVSESSRVASEASFSDWIEFHREKGSSQVSNFHVMALSTIRWTETGKLKKATPQDHLQSALGFLRTLPAIGFVEDFDESLRRMNARVAAELDLGETAPYQAPTLNISASREAALADRLERLRTDLGDDGFVALVEMNALDQMLYDWAFARERISRFVQDAALEL